MNKLNRIKEIASYEQTMDCMNTPIHLEIFGMKIRSLLWFDPLVWFVTHTGLTEASCCRAVLNTASCLLGYSCWSVSSCNIYPKFLSCRLYSHFFHFQSFTTLTLTKMGHPKFIPLHQPPVVYFLAATRL